MNSDAGLVFAWHKALPEIVVCPNREKTAGILIIMITLLSFSIVYRLQMTKKNIVKAFVHWLFVGKCDICPPRIGQPPQCHPVEVWIPWYIQLNPECYCNPRVKEGKKEILTSESALIYPTMRQQMYIIFISKRPCAPLYLSQTKQCDGFNEY